MSTKHKVKKEQIKATQVKQKLNEKQENGDFPTNWDLDKYRREYESEKHWQLRRYFMEKHKKMFPEDRLVSLAQVFTNIEFMGCKYPPETMRMVAELSKDVVKEFRAGRVNRLKRKFVTASDAAEVRAKGRRITQVNDDNRRTGISYNNNQELQKKHFFIKESHEEAIAPNSGIPMKRKKTINIFEGLKYGEFIVILNGGRNCIRQSCLRCNVEYLEKEVEESNGRKKVEIYINSQLVADACEDNLKTSKAEAFIRALTTLQQHCYSIKQNPLRDTIKIEKANNKIVCDVIKTPVDFGDDKKLDSTNKGYKMMKSMGWSGGGLGLQKQGREDPVSFLLKNNRAGLGNQAGHLNNQYFTQILKNYVKSDDVRELQFEPTFTKDERAMLHLIAQKFNLKSCSVGQDQQRRLVISKKTITERKILEQILLEKNSQYLNRYFVQVPVSKSSLFPEHTAKLSLNQ